MTAPLRKPESAARLFAALADPTRLALLVTLRSGPPRPIARLALSAGMTRQAVTKHLHILETAGFVTAIRTGRETHYSHDPGTLDQVRTALDAIAGNWSAVRAAEPSADDRG